MSDLDILGLPWPEAQRYLVEIGIRYLLKETFSPNAKKDKITTGIVVRVLEKSDEEIEITLAYPIMNPILPTSSP